MVAMNNTYLQIAGLTLFGCVYLILVRPWRLKVEARAVLNIVTAILYYCALLTLFILPNVGKAPQPISDNILILFGMICLIPVVVYIVAKRKDKNTQTTHKVLEKGLGAIGTFALIVAYLGYASTYLFAFTENITRDSSWVLKGMAVLNILAFAIPAVISFGAFFVNREKVLEMIEYIRNKNRDAISWFIAFQVIMIILNYLAMLKLHS